MFKRSAPTSNVPSNVPSNVTYNRYGEKMDQTFSKIPFTGFNAQSTASTAQSTLKHSIINKEALIQNADYRPTIILDPGTNYLMNMPNSNFNFKNSSKASSYYPSSARALQNRHMEIQQKVYETTKPINSSIKKTIFFRRRTHTSSNENQKRDMISQQREQIQEEYGSVKKPSAEQRNNDNSNIELTFNPPQRNSSLKRKSPKKPIANAITNDRNTNSSRITTKIQRCILCRDQISTKNRHFCMQCEGKIYAPSVGVEKKRDDVGIGVEQGLMFDDLIQRIFQFPICLGR